MDWGRRLFGATLGVSVSMAVCVAAQDETPGWDSSAAFGFVLTDGNSETLSMNMSVGGSLEREEHEVRLGLEGNYGESTTETTVEERTVRKTDTTTQNAKGSAYLKRKFGTGYVYSDNSLLHDDSAAIDYRLNVGLGGGLHVLESETVKTGIELGAAFIHEEYTTPGRDDYVALRLAGRHDHVLSETANFWLAVEYMPTVDTWQDYLVNGEAGVEAVLRGRLNIRFVVQDRYDSDPPAARDKNDLSAIGALAYKL